MLAVDERETDRESLGSRFREHPAGAAKGGDSVRESFLIHRVPESVHHAIEAVVDCDKLAPIGFGPDRLMFVAGDADSAEIDRVGMCAVVVLMPILTRWEQVDGVNATAAVFGRMAEHRRRAPAPTPDL